MLRGFSLVALAEARVALADALVALAVALVALADALVALVDALVTLAVALVTLADVLVTLADALVTLATGGAGGRLVALVVATWAQVTLGCPLFSVLYLMACTFIYVLGFFFLLFVPITPRLFCPIT